MPASLCYLTVLKHYDLIGMTYCRDPVSDDDLGSIFKLAKVLLYLMLGLHIKRRSRIIKYEYRCMLCKSSCHAESLLLTAGQTDTSFADYSLGTILQFFNKAQSTGL